MLHDMPKPRYLDSIGRLLLVEAESTWSVFVTTGAIEKLANAPADDQSLLSSATILEGIAREKLRTGQTLGDRIWIRSLDVPGWH